MKLVNVEDLKVLVAVESKGEIRYGKLVTDLFDDIDTVEAIPVEWIKARLKKAVDFTHSKAEGKFIDNGCVVSVVSANFTANVLLNLLEDWRKENETN